MSGEFRELARRLRRLEEGVKAQNVPQLAHSSVEDGAIEVCGGDLVTREKFAGDFVLHVEFMTPAMPHANGQAKGNSGVFGQSRYLLV